MVGTALLPTVAQQVGLAQADGNVTGAADTLVGLTTLFFALAIATSAIGERNAHRLSNYPMQKPNIGSTSLRKNLIEGQDRSGNTKIFIFAPALETAKVFPLGMRYSPNSDYKMKSEINKMIAAQGGARLKPLQVEIFDETAEFPSISLRGQDRSVKHKNYAQETDNAYFTFSIEDESKIYSPNSDYKMKSEINKNVEKQWININPPIT